MSDQCFLPEHCHEGGMGETKMEVETTSLTGQLKYDSNHCQHTHTVSKVPEGEGLPLAVVRWWRMAAMGQEKLLP